MTDFNTEAGYAQNNREHLAVPESGEMLQKNQKKSSEPVKATKSQPKVPNAQS